MTFAKTGVHFYLSFPGLPAGRLACSRNPGAGRNGNNEFLVNTPFGVDNELGNGAILPKMGRRKDILLKYFDVNKKLLNNIVPPSLRSGGMRNCAALVSGK